MIMIIMLPIKGLAAGEASQSSRPESDPITAAAKQGAREDSRNCLPQI